LVIKAEGYIAPLEQCGNGVFKFPLGTVIIKISINSKYCWKELAEEKPERSSGACLSLHMLTCQNLINFTKKYRIINTLQWRLMAGAVVLQFGKYFDLFQRS
jgi:hypothetical protein